VGGVWMCGASEVAGGAGAKRGGGRRVVGSSRRGFVFMQFMFRVHLGPPVCCMSLCRRAGFDTFVACTARSCLVRFFFVLAVRSSLVFFCGLHPWSVMHFMDTRPTPCLRAHRRPHARVGFFFFFLFLFCVFCGFFFFWCFFFCCDVSVVSSRLGSLSGPGQFLPYQAGCFVCV